jgi:cell division protease FtsH
MTEEIDEIDVRRFAAEFRAFMEVIHRFAVPMEPSPLIERLREHLGVEPLGLPVITEPYPPYEHPNVQAAIDAYLTEPGVTADLVGIIGSNREHEGLVDIIVSAGRHRQYELGAVDYATVAVGVGKEAACVSFGLYLLAIGDARLAVLMRVGSRRTGMPQLALEVLSADAEAARRFLRRIRELSVVHHVGRGQVLSF